MSLVLPRIGYYYRGRSAGGNASMLSDLMKSNPEILAILIAILGFLAAGLLSRFMEIGRAHV